MNGEPKRPEPETADAATDTPDADSAGQDLEAALAEAQAQASENRELYLRAAAEAENVRKRAMRDVEHARRFALENFSRELLDVKDSLEMGLEAAGTADKSSLIEGTEATLKLLTSKLEQFGVLTIDPAGEPFDPEKHEAMSMQPSRDLEPGSVLTVIQKGYELNGRLLRPARVIVAAEMPADAEN